MASPSQNEGKRVMHWSSMGCIVGVGGAALLPLIPAFSEPFITVVDGDAYIPLAYAGGGCIGGLCNLWSRFDVFGFSDGGAGYSRPKPTSCEVRKLGLRSGWSVPVANRFGRQVHRIHQLARRLRDAYCRSRGHRKFDPSIYSPRTPSARCNRWSSADKLERLEQRFKARGLSSTRCRSGV